MSEIIEFSAEELQKRGAGEEEALQIAETIKKNIAFGANFCWQKLISGPLHPDSSRAVLEYLYRKLFRMDQNPGSCPPVWIPDSERIKNSNIYQTARGLGLETYDDFYRWSACNRAGFWDLSTRKLGIPFRKEYKQVVRFKDSLENPEWYPEAELNIADACFRAAPGQTAIIYGREDGSTGQMSYGELDQLSNRVANALTARGFKKGHTAAIDMLMTAEAVAIYLGIIKAGGAVVSIADSLAAPEVHKRLKIAGARILFTQDYLLRGSKKLPLYEKLLTTEMPPCIVLPAEDERACTLRKEDLHWQDFLSENEEFDSLSCLPGDVCNILFSSGTTGDPKAIPWTHSTPVKSAADAFYHHDIHEGDVVAWPTNIGWMMGPWLIFASLINRAGMALYYGAPTGRDFGVFVEKAGVTMLGLVPSMVKRWIESDCMKGLDWSSIKVFSSTGESSNPIDYLWLMARGGFKPVIEYCGGTEIGGGYFSGTVVQPATPSTFSSVTLGLDVLIMDENGQSADKGELFIVPPSVGLSTSLLNKDHHKTYYEDVPPVKPDMLTAMGLTLEEEVYNLGLPPIIRRHGDEVEKLENGYFRAHGRADDTMNLGGIKTSSVEIERLLDNVNGVKETAAIASNPKDGGPSQLVIYVVLKEGEKQSRETLMKTFQQLIKEKLNPLFKVSDVVLRQSLPRTASNKVMRRLLRDEYEKISSEN